MKPVIDKVALWTEIPDQKMFTKTFIGRLEYQHESGTLGVASPLTPVYSYAKNFTKFGLTFSLFVYTLDASTESVANRFDKILKKIKKKDILEVTQTSGFDNFRFIEEKK